VSVERVKNYSTLEQEPPHYSHSESPYMTQGGDHWPSKGAVEFVSVKMRYRDGLPLVLRGLDINIRGGEKVGIVGRTGRARAK
jgi:ATP-binding cassette, subfamily C (CFTR/MRP), member 1